MSCSTWKLKYLPVALHSKNGSPVVSDGHEHIGAWSMTRQSAARPHAPTHGSTHLLRTHARSRAHSELTTHSGRQPPDAASPLVPDGHEHTAVLPDTVQRAPGPHGDGVHGGAASDNEITYINYVKKDMSSYSMQCITDIILWWNKKTTNINH